MSYRTVSTFVHETQMNSSALEPAISFARDHDAHLQVLIAGINTVDPDVSYAAGHPSLMFGGFEEAATLQTSLRDDIETRMAHEDVRWGEIHAVIQSGAISQFLSSNARFSDLVILPKPYGCGRHRADVAVLEAALFDASVPILIVPEGKQSCAAPKNILIAWDQSTEALNATRAALPLIAKADRVEIAIIDPPHHGPERSDPGGALAEMVARHGAKPVISVLGKSEGRVSDILLNRAMEQHSDLIIMGGYGHSRMRQAILGGTTRRMLEDSTVPIFMAH